MYGHFGAMVAKARKLKAEFRPIVDEFEKRLKDDYERATGKHTNFIFNIRFSMTLLCKSKVEHCHWLLLLLLRNATQLPPLLLVLLLLFVFLENEHSLFVLVAKSKAGKSRAAASRRKKQVRESK